MRQGARDRVFFGVCWGVELPRFPLLRTVSVQFGAASDSFDEGRLAPFSAPLGTIGGTFLGASVPVGRSAAASELGVWTEGTAGSDANADAWS